MPGFNHVKYYNFRLTHPKSCVKNIFLFMPVDLVNLKVFFFMKRENRRWVRELAYYSSIGLSLALSIFIGLGVGIYLDRHVFGTTPWLTLGFLVIGIIAGFRNIALAIKKIRKF